MKSKRLLVITILLCMLTISALANEPIGSSIYNLENNLNNNRKKQYLETDNAENSIISPENRYNTEEFFTNTVGFNEDRSRLLTAEDNGILLADAIDSFNPNVNIVGEYNADLFEGSINDGNSNVSLPGIGQYQINGNITDMEIQYIQNPGAEMEQQFYSDDVIQAGLQLERINYARSLEGNYVWKLYSNNDETMKYALYQEDIDLLQSDTKISYSYLLESNSSLQNIINSSLIFDFVFDTCRIMVILWHYTNLNPPLIGENTTTPFVVYRLLENSSWDDKWNNYSLSIFDLFSEEDPYIPTMLKSIGFYVISPEASECSILIDNFRIETSLVPTNVNLKINDTPVNSVEQGSGTFEIMFEVIEEVSTYEYNLVWDYNSSYEIHANYTINITGQVNILFEKNVILSDENSIFYEFIAEDIMVQINPLNLSYPDFWTLIGEIDGFEIISNHSDGGGLNTLTLSRLGGGDDMFCSFEIPNLITSTSYTSTVVFETVNASFELSVPFSDISIGIFWFADYNGSSLVNLIDNTLMYQFPSWIPEGYVDVTFTIIEANYIGFANESFLLTRYPAQIEVLDEITMPRYTLAQIWVNYTSLAHDFAIEEATVYGELNGEIIQAMKLEDAYYFLVSAFYLSESNYSFEIFALSSTHASVIESISISIYESNMSIVFEYEKMDKIATYQLSFYVFSDNCPVGFAPLRIDINGEESIMGITGSEGMYLLELILPLDCLKVNITCVILKISMVLASETFEINFNNLQAEISRSEEESIISENMTISYFVQYPASHDRWFVFIDEKMPPILEAYIETETLQIPVYWDSNVLYWQAQADEVIKNHKLIIQTIGPRLYATIEEEEDEINIHFVIEADIKSYKDISLVFYLNESYSTSKYQWKLLSSKLDDVSTTYHLEINDLYVHLSNIDVNMGSFLILDLVGIRMPNNSITTNIVIPLVSSSGVLLGAVIAIIRIYSKKKGMILEI